MSETDLSEPRPGETGGDSRGQLDVSVVIVNWNARELVCACIESVVTQVKGLRWEVIVIDNASSDGSQAEIQKRFPQVRLIQNQDNRGFAGANNQGFAEAQGRYVLLLNPDTEVLDGAIHKLIAYGDRHPDVGVVGCQVYSGPEQLEPSCFGFPGPLNLLIIATGLNRVFPRNRLFGRPRMTWWDRKSERDVQVVTGDCMLVRREAMIEVGFMDDDYFIYAEEADWCYRFWKHGWRCRFTPEARVLHHGGQSTKLVRVRMFVQLHKSLVMFNRKNGGVMPALLARSIFIVQSVVRGGFLALISLVRKDARQKLLCHAANLRYLLSGALPKQRQGSQGVGAQTGAKGSA